MSDNNRDSQRVGLVIDIKVTYQDKKECILKSQNISDHGVFLEYGSEPLDLAIGTEVILQVCSQFENDAPAPVKAKIARITDLGMGIEFIL